MFIVHDKRLPAEYIGALNARVPSITWIPFGGPDDSHPRKVYESISCHPDIYFFQLDEKTLVHAPNVPEEILFSLSKNGIELVKGEKFPHGSYPYTAPYNAVRVGEAVFHNLQCADTVMLKKIHEFGLKTVNVSQGYSRCSVLALDDKALITADKGIAEAVCYARETGNAELDALVISSGSVLLPGEKYGFLGGASGKMPDGTVLFLGDIDLHPNASKIKDFLIKCCVDYIDLKGLPLYDAGGLITLTPGPTSSTSK
jgi:hypothetical protein